MRNKLGYLFAPPGWSPDGSTLTAKQIREAHLPARVEHSRGVRA
jgi:hypothetical protein